ncbi:CPBP family intramembrane glutamic endopeptidase [Solitalea lacus]|uniref:CPBP family intramembrane glutamic endopeptidase n=1 Tax=Solitalea lacus TaxID=2911172 RepID=UPI001EDC7FC9|nr:CPBP family intramembrane glutamic endopeptidase [Solitalea lacus]UKJ06110.1 CPBP family intramembrane metalloprotease [Solitalea lacus]
MVGILVLLLFSWFILWLAYKRNLNALGIIPTLKRLNNFSLGLVCGAIICFLHFGTLAILSKSNVVLNPNFTFFVFLNSFWWTLSSVLFEELIFRGALLYIAIQKIGIKRACFLSAIAFGIYHWFSFGVLGNWQQMLIIFFMTSIWGMMFAYAFTKTNSLYLPIGLHLGWNLAHIVILSQGPLGNQMLIFNENHKLTGLSSLVFFILQISILPLLTYIYLNNKQEKDTINAEKAA